MVGVPSCYNDIAEHLSQQHSSDKRNNRQCLLKILSNLRFLSRQGISLRGDDQELNSNFTQLLILRGEDDPRIDTWLNRKSNKYTSHDIQNELLKVMALSIVRKIAGYIKIATFFVLCAMNVQIRLTGSKWSFALDGLMMNWSLMKILLDCIW